MKIKKPTQSRVLKEDTTKTIDQLKSIYRKYARVNESTKITNKNLNSSALTRVAEAYAFNEDVLKEALL